MSRNFLILYKSKCWIKIFWPLFSFIVVAANSVLLNMCLRNVASKHSNGLHHKKPLILPLGSMNNLWNWYVLLSTFGGNINFRGWFPLTDLHSGRESCRTFHHLQKIPSSQPLIHTRHSNMEVQCHRTL